MVTFMSKTVDELMNDLRNQTDDEGAPSRLIQCPYQAHLMGKDAKIPCPIRQTRNIPCTTCPADDTAVFNKVMENLNHE